MIIKSIKKYFEENFKNDLKSSLNNVHLPTIDVYKSLIRKKNNTIYIIIIKILCALIFG
jgi:hypothetical protein